MRGPVAAAAGVELMGRLLEMRAVHLRRHAQRLIDRLQSSAAFWRVMLLVVASGVITLIAFV